ncbi:MAG: hypothetical protein JWM36_4349 [Hyphomicrobiales bacterium]|nr:hypothetical protein [Hyphomicrobiales bacterium]
MATFKVLRRMEGDKLYDAGDTREMSKADAAHLVKLGVLEPVDTVEDEAKTLAPAPKSEGPAASNKMELAPMNKTFNEPKSSKG